MRKGWRTVIALALALLVIAAIASVVVAHYVTGGTCAPTEKTDHHGPSGAVATVTVTRCEKDTEVSVELVESGKRYMLFLASTSLSYPGIELHWRSATLLELRYPSTMQVRLPPELHQVRNIFGQTEVSYVAL